MINKFKKILDKAEKIIKNNLQIIFTTSNTEGAELTGFNQKIFRIISGLNRK